MSCDEAVSRGASGGGGGGATVKSDQQQQQQDQDQDLANGNSSVNGGEMSSHGGARPKIRPRLNNSNGGGGDHQLDQVVPVPEEAQDSDDVDVEESDDDFYVYRYKYTESSSSLTADLPKSFYQLDVGSDSDGANGVSGPGQSNLSDEVAALIQGRRHPNNANVAAAANNDGGQQQQNNNTGRESPDMDFLEMDFDPEEENSEQEQEQPLVQERPNNLGLEVKEPQVQVVGEEVEEEELDRLNGGMVSAPLQSPAGGGGGDTVEQHLGTTSMMVRSRSLNSPLGNVGSSCGVMVRGESDPGRMKGLRNKRRHSGEDGLCNSSSSSASMSADPLVNMEVCGARLSQREALVFGVPGSGSGVTNVHRAMLKLRMLDRSAQHEEEEEEEELESLKKPIEEHLVEKTMIWTELEACKRQVHQVGVSACGATAVINVLQALEWPFDVDEVVKTVPTKLRAETALVPEYLFSRSVAGTCHDDLIRSVDKLTDGQIVGRFFAMYPPRRISLSQWLSKWLSRGAVPIATLNLQRGLAWRPGQTIPDAWHHQMIFGVGPSGVYMTNPLESVAECVLNEQLCSSSHLLVRRADILLRWHPNCDLSVLADVDNDERWDNMNVLGQVVNVLREEQQKSAAANNGSSSGNGSNSPSNGNGQQQQPRTQTSHVRIPAGYQSGISLFVPVTNEECLRELKECHELPLASQTTNFCYGSQIV